MSYQTNVDENKTVSASELYNFNKMGKLNMIRKNNLNSFCNKTNDK